MHRTKNSIKENILKYAYEVDKLFDGIEVRLFGSFYKGKTTPYSDIDLAIISEDFKGIDYILALKILNRIKIGIDNSIEAIPVIPEDILTPQLGSIEYDIAQGNELIFKSDF